jgi:creatinine amidohydrolase
VIADAVVEAATRDRADVLVAPTLQYGSSGEHAGFPGTISLGQQALRLAVLELVRSADWFGSVVLACWHGGNTEVLNGLEQQLASEGRPIRIWRPAPAGVDLHAGWTETSLMLHLDGSRVRRERPRGVVADLVAVVTTLKTSGVRAVAPNGILGDASGASAESGREIFELLVSDLRRFLG